MYDMNDILSDFPNGNNESSTFSTNQDISSEHEILKKEQRKLRKKLKCAKKKGKSGKKYKKKLRKLKEKYDELKVYYCAVKKPAARGCWDGLFEKTLPEAFKLANTVIDRMLPPRKGV